VTGGWAIRCESCIGCHGRQVPIPEGLPAPYDAQSDAAGERQNHNRSDAGIGDRSEPVRSIWRDERRRGSCRRTPDRMFCRQLVLTQGRPNGELTHSEQLSPSTCFLEI